MKTLRRKRLTLIIMLTLAGRYDRILWILADVKRAAYPFL